MKTQNENNINKSATNRAKREAVFEAYIKELEEASAKLKAKRAKREAVFEAYIKELDAKRIS